MSRPSARADRAGGSAPSAAKPKPVPSVMAAWTNRRRFNDDLLPESWRRAGCVPVGLVRPGMSASVRDTVLSPCEGLLGQLAEGDLGPEWSGSDDEAGTVDHDAERCYGNPIPAEGFVCMLHHLDMAMSVAICAGRIDCEKAQ